MVQTRHYKDKGISSILGYKVANKPEVLGSIDFEFMAVSHIRKLRHIDSLHTGSEESWNQVVRWNHQCLNSHITCKQFSQSKRLAGDTFAKEWPTRFLVVGNINDPTIKITEISDLEPSTLVYMTLSHRWGQYNPIKLLRDNYSTFQQGVSMGDLPKTFRNAVEVTRKLGLPYLWIDSLCIIQDSNEDWAVESSKMHKVYKNSFLNLVAAASSDATGGLYNPRIPMSFAPCVIDIGRRNQPKYTVSWYTPEDQGCDLDILKRGWVFQELLLSPRILIFGKKELHWYCCQLHGTETFPDYEGEDEEMGDMSELRKYWRDMHDKSNEWRWNTWRELVGKYSAKELTRFSDRLVAVAGLAADLGRTWDSDYLAGLWSYRLRRGLLWRSEAPGPPQYVSNAVPSWSWGSMSGAISTDHPDYYDGLAEVLDAKVRLSDESIGYGQVTGGYIQLKSPLCRASTRKKGDKWEIEFGADWPNDGSMDLSQFGISSTINASVKWDDKATDDTIRAASVYLAPFEVSITERAMNLDGLVLVPTYATAGEYRRLGWFQVQDYWGYKIDWNMALNNLLNARSTLADKRHITVLEVKALFEGARDQNQEALQEMQNNNFQKLKESFSHSKETKTMGDVSPRIASLRQDDRYFNGITKGRLLDRYEKILENSDYPQINSFLSCMHAFADLGVEDRLMSETLYETYHGDGYFTFRIV